MIKISSILGLCIIWLWLPLCSHAQEIALPDPAFSGKTSVEAAMVGKKSVRSFKQTPLSQKEISQMLWAANGNIPVDGVSSATVKVIPSAGRIYALEIYLVVGTNTVQNIPAGIYKYVPEAKKLEPVSAGDVRKLLAHACWSQMWMADAPALVVITGDIPKMTQKYADQAAKYVHMEAGNSNQNLYLQGESLGVRMGTVGAFVAPQVSGVLKLPPNLTPLLICPMGK